MRIKMKSFNKIAGLFMFMFALTGCWGGDDLPTTGTSSRYVMFHAKNDGTLGNSSYIELRSVKLFNATSTSPGTNFLNGTFTGGVAHVESVAGLDGATNYQTTLGTTCNETWYPEGTLCDEIPNTHDQNVSQKINAASGATWNNPTLGSSIGAIVMDMGEVKAFNRLSVFQMYSDGKMTHIKMFRHPETSATAPLHTDAGWIQVFDYQAVGAGSSPTGDNLTVTNPLIVNIP